MKRVMIFYPPGKIYQRGEDRSQGNIDESTATSMRAANDLGYAASVLKRDGHEVFVRDYQTERLPIYILHKDISNFNPDVIFVSITNATINSDIDLINKLKENNNDLVVIIKGAIFFNPPESLLSLLDLRNIDFLIGMESDFVISSLISYIDKKDESIDSISGLLYKDSQGHFKRTSFAKWHSNIDDLPFPDRGLMNNTLYVRPDTGEPQATIITSRGCPSKCIFCSTPIISGKKLRLRSIDGVIDEIKECYEKYRINNFFFRSDTFTYNLEWTEELCGRIAESEMSGKIKWVANSKVKPIRKKTLQAMKDAGCWLVAFGYESGHPESLMLMKKDTTVDDGLIATQLAKEVGLQTFGFFLIGLPWEDETHLEATKRMIFELDNDFIEIHISVPYPGTELYDICVKEGLIKNDIIGYDYFNPPIIGSKYIELSAIEKFRKDTLLQFHARPKYILKKILAASSNKTVLVNYMKYGYRLIKNTLPLNPMNHHRSA